MGLKPGTADKKLEYPPVPGAGGWGHSYKGRTGALDCIAQPINVISDNISDKQLPQICILVLLVIFVLELSSKQRK